MTEDLLSHDERLRLECVAQAVALHAMKPTPSAEHIVSMGRQFAAYIADPPEDAPQVSKEMATFGLGQHTEPPAPTGRPEGRQ